MPQYPNYPSSKILDVDTAVKDGLLGSTTLTSASTGRLLDHGDDSKAPIDLKLMIEQLESCEEDLDVPKVFICPISLEPMTDPVTLCTGHTYDRANISRWLSTGRLSCPTTMQDLWNDAVTPNATLRQLILAWFSQRYHHAKKRSSDVHGAAIDLLLALRKAKGSAKVPVLREIRHLVTSSPSSSKTVADAGGVAVVSSLLGPFTSHAVGSEAISVLVNLPLDQEAKVGLMQPARASVVVDMLSEGSPETKLYCVSFLEMLLTADEEEEGQEEGQIGCLRAEIAASLSLLVGLLRMVKDRKNPTGILPALRLLRSLSPQEHVRGALIGVGAIAHLVDLLPELPTECLELALHVLELLTARGEGIECLKGCARAIPNVVRVIMRVSEGCTGHALEVLRGACDGEPEGVAAAVEAGMAARLLLVMQSGCSAGVKQKAAELLKLCSRSYCSETRFMSKCKLTRTIQG